MSGLPSGNVTFLFTDIEGSTKLWEDFPEEMRVALARHDALLRDAIQKHNGHVFKTVGDMFCAVFAEPADALSATVSAQQSIAGMVVSDRPLRVRMAVHCGTADERDGDYFGPTLNRIARILAIVHGGQVILSETAWELTAGALPGGSSTRDMGTHRLKDLQRDEHVYQLVHASLEFEFPPLRSLTLFANNLPVQLTSFIGRERELSEIKRQLASARLLTLTGIGGCGKTRLAIQAAADILEDYPGGVWLIELANLSDPALVPQTVTSALGLREEPGRSHLETLTEHLRSRQALLLLDNCEHLVQACARLADGLLRGCPQVKILASSREGLGISGEKIFNVPSLSLPDPKRASDIAALQQNEAVRLFCDRAEASQPRFGLTRENASAIAQICNRLDGIPLALELAAARVRVLSPEQIATRLDDRFRLLTGGSRAALPRQQTLRALIDWSYDLLTEPERTLLRRLAVFLSGWPLEAAESICVGGAVEDWEVLDLLTQLIEKSLVVVDNADESDPRYRLLHTVREYGMDRLVEAGEAEDLRDKHRLWFQQLVADAEPQLTGASQAKWLNRLETEHDNVRSALEWAVRSDPASALLTAGNLWRYWTVRGYFSEGRDWLTKVLADPAAEGQTKERALALRAAGSLASNQGEFGAARELLEESLSMWRALGDDRGTAGALNTLGNVVWSQSDYPAARTLYEESLELARRLNDKRATAVALISLGNVCSQQAENEQARTFYQEALSACRAVGSREWEAATMQNLGGVLNNLGDHAGARALYEQSLDIRRELGDRRGISACLGQLGNALRDGGDLTGAKPLYEEALELARELGDRQWEAVTLQDYAKLKRISLDQDAAVELHEQSLNICVQLNDRFGIAVSLHGLGMVACQRGDFRAAARFLSASTLMREQIHAPIAASDREEYDISVQLVRDNLGAEFDSAWSEGEAVLDQLLGGEIAADNALFLQPRRA